MIHTIKYLNSCITDSPEDTLNELREELGIRASHDTRFPELYVLNYNQIDSEKHKYHPIVLECRSLVVEYVRMGEWKVVSRAFDRFFNLGEGGAEANLDMDEFTAFEKMDGSLISVFYHDNYGWLYRTKSMIMPELECSQNGLSWKNLIEDAFGELFMADFPTYYISSRPECTYVMEFTSPLNRIVTRYDSPEMTLLAVRDNNTGMYINQDSTSMLATKMGLRRPKSWSFDSKDDCVDFVNNLPDLQEGVILYNRYGIPSYKIKSPDYVAAHYMKGEVNPTPKRIVKMIDSGEIPEFLSVFPELGKLIKPYTDAYTDMLTHAIGLASSVRDIPDPKERARLVGGSPVSTIVFKILNGADPKEAYDSLLNTYKVKLLTHYKDLNESRDEVHMR